MPELRMIVLWKVLKAYRYQHGAMNLYSPTKFCDGVQDVDGPNGVEFPVYRRHILRYANLEEASCYTICEIF